MSIRGALRKKLREIEFQVMAEEKSHGSDVEGRKFLEKARKEESKRNTNKGEG